MTIPPVPPPFSYTQIDALLLAVADELPRRPNWYADVARFGGRTTAETRLPVYQAVRDDGCLPEDVGFFLVSYACEDFCLEGTRFIQAALEWSEENPKSDDSLEWGEDEWDDAALDEDDWAEDGFDEDGFDDEDDDEDEDLDDDLDEDDGGLVDEVEELCAELHKNMPWPHGNSREELMLHIRQKFLSQKMIKYFFRYGEREMAVLLARYGDEFRQRREQGRRFFFEPPEPGAAELRGLVQGLYDHLRQCVGSRSPLGPLACRWSIDYGFVDLHVFPTPVELVGGPQDGAVVDPDVDFDLLRVQEAFDRVEGISWSLDGEKREFQYVCFRGAYRGYDFWVTVFAGAPEGEKPTMKSDELRKWRAYRGDAAE